MQTAFPLAQLEPVRVLGICQIPAVNKRDDVDPITHVFAVKLVLSQICKKVNDECLERLSKPVLAIGRVDARRQESVVQQHVATSTEDFEEDKRVAQLRLGRLPGLADEAKVQTQTQHSHAVCFMIVRKVFQDAKGVFVVAADVVLNVKEAQLGGLGTVAVTHLLLPVSADDVFEPGQGSEEVKVWGVADVSDRRQHPLGGKVSASVHVVVERCPVLAEDNVVEFPIAALDAGDDEASVRGFSILRVVDAFPDDFPALHLNKRTFFRKKKYNKNFILKRFMTIVY